MQLNDIFSAAQDQDRGRDFELRDPVSGSPTGITLRIVGPDSATQQRARLALADALAEAMEDTGRITAATRERLRIASLAACVVGWEITEDGAPVPFNQANVIRLLSGAQWVHEQVDSYAADRAAFRGNA